MISIGETFILRFDEVGNFWLYTEDEEAAESHRQANLTGYLALHNYIKANGPFTYDTMTPEQKQLIKNCGFIQVHSWVEKKEE